MTPPKHWTDMLQATWPHLYFRWNLEAEKWEVWDNPGNTPEYRVHTIQNNDGSYRPIDNRIFALIARNDMSRLQRGERFLDVLDRPIVAERRARAQRATEHNHEYAERLRSAFMRDGA